MYMQELEVLFNAKGAFSLGEESSIYYNNIRKKLSEVSADLSSEVVCEYLNSEVEKKHKYETFFTFCEQMYLKNNVEDDDLTQDFTVYDSWLLSQQFIYSWARLYSKKIPFKEWSDIAEQGLKLLVYFIENKIYNFKETEEYIDFKKSYAERHEDLRLNRGYEGLDTWFDD